MTAKAQYTQTVDEVVDVLVSLRPERDGTPEGVSRWYDWQVAVRRFADRFSSSDASRKAFLARTGYSAHAPAGGNLL